MKADLCQLIERIKKIRPCTREGVYKALRKLTKEEIIVIHKSVTSLNLNWVARLSRFTAAVHHHYVTDIAFPGYFTQLSDGDKVQYYFKNPNLLNSYWTHALITLLQITPPHEHCFSYHPHHWFIIARPESEQALLQNFAENKKYLLLTVGDRLPFDKHVNSLISKEYVQYHMLGKQLFEKLNYYVNIIGDFVIEAWLDKNTEKKIERLYNTTAAVTPEKIERLREIVEQRGKNKIAISRNARKAERLRRKLRKYFYIPPHQNVHEAQPAPA